MATPLEYTFPLFAINFICNTESGPEPNIYPLNFQQQVYERMHCALY